MDENPGPETDAPIDLYAPPAAQIGEAPAGSTGAITEAEAVRRKYINHETSVRSVGSLHMLGALILIIPLIFFLLAAASPVGQEFEPSLSGAALAMNAAFALVSGMNLVLGFGLRRLRPWARWTEVVLLGVPTVAFLIMVVTWGMPPGWGDEGFYLLGTPIAVYILFLLLSPKAAVIFAPDYIEVIAKTQNVKSKSGWLARGLVLFCMALAILMIVVVIVFISVQRDGANLVGPSLDSREPLNK